MNNVSSAHHLRLALGGTAVLFALCTLQSSPVLAADVLGLYVGGAIGQAQVNADGLPDPFSGTAPGFGDFRENHAAYKVMAGVRPLSLVGAEVEYIDFGHPGGIVGVIPVGLSSSAQFPVFEDVRMQGTAAFGVLYLPVPVVDVYVKAGLARIQATGSVTFTEPAPYAACVSVAGPNCRFSLPYSVTNTGLAGGAGVQVRIGSLALRGEYERFSAAGANPGLFSVGLLWTFL